MTATLLLGQNVNLTGELGVRMNGTGLSKNLTSFDLVPLNATEQSADVVAGLSAVKELAEHFDTGNNDLAASSVRPTISTSSETLRVPLSTRPVATVPRPVMENTSSTGIRKGASVGR